MKEEEGMRVMRIKEIQLRHLPALLAGGVLAVCFHNEALAGSSLNPPTLKIPSSLLQKSGVPMADIKSSIFLQNKNLPAPLTLTSEGVENPLTLSHVSFFGNHNDGIWLRTQCDTRAKVFALEECRGSVCKATGTSQKSEGGKHARIFRGEYGSYALARAQWGERSLAAAALDSSSCGKTFPAWAVAARALNKNSDLEFPRNLLILQVSQKIFLVDATLNSLWNEIPWNSEKGVFQQGTLSSDGRLLLQNRTGDALYLNFSQGTFVHFSHGTARTALQGLNALFGTQDIPFSQLNQTTFTASSERSHFVNLGGVWTPTGFVTWSDLTTALLTKREPVPRPYTTTGQLEAALWSEESGIEKSYILLKVGQTFELLSTENGGKTFTKTKTFGWTRSEDTFSGTFIHENFITKMGKDGALLVNSGGERTTPDAQLFSNAGQLVQNSFELLSLIPHPTGTSCRATLFTPKKDTAGWLQRQVLSDIPCSSGTGRSSTATSIVDISDGTIKITILE
ncbi:MAG: hypothetical protein RIR26_265 [Pseudomonadota bacterium]